MRAILAGRLAPGAHVIVTSRPHTLTYLQVNIGQTCILHKHDLTHLLVMFVLPHIIATQAFVTLVTHKSGLRQAAGSRHWRNEVSRLISRLLKTKLLSGWEIANLDLLRAWVKRGSARSSTLSSRTRSRLTTGRCSSSSSSSSYVLGRSLCANIISTCCVSFVWKKSISKKQWKLCSCIIVSQESLPMNLYFISILWKNKLSYKVECTELCPCRTLQQRARADRSL